MKPIVDITEALGAQKYVTISMLGPLLYKLLNRTLKNCDSDCRLVKNDLTENERESTWPLY